MKKYIAGSIAIVVAIVSFAFTPAKFHEGLNCEENLYWIKVLTSASNQACNQIVLSELDLKNDVNFNSTPDELEFKLESANPYGCTDNEFACALGFKYNVSDPTDPTNELIRVQTSPGVFQWQPKANTSGVITSFSCCVYRPIP